MGRLEETPDGIVGESSRRSSTIPFRAGSPRGSKAAARSRGSAARHRPGGLGPPLQPL